MPKKSKPFIDKKNATKYHLFYRSQRDTEHITTGSNHVLVATSETKNPIYNHNEEIVDLDTCLKTPLNNIDMSVLEQELATMGVSNTSQHNKHQFDDSDYDYSKHLRPISGNGTFYSRDGSVTQRNPNASIFQEDVVEEVPRQFDSIMLSTDCLDEEIQQILFDDYEDGEFEEILDDFCITANQDFLPHEGEGEEKPREFDYKTHIEELIKRAKNEEEYDEFDAEFGNADNGFFQGMVPLSRQLELSNENFIRQRNSISHDDDNTTRATSVVCETVGSTVINLQKFQDTLAEYDSDEIGDLGHEYDEIQGFLPTDNNKALEAAIQDFYLEKKDDVLVQGLSKAERAKRGGNRYKVLQGTQMKPMTDIENIDLSEVKNLQTLEEQQQEANLLLRQPYEAPPVEDVLIDGKSYFTVTSRNPWDCETILTTYSNLDNNPTTIGRSQRKIKKQSKERIQLSNKTGLPIVMLPQTEFEEEGEDANVNLGEARSKKETKEGKKKRKELLKHKKREKRQQKQLLKIAFKEEFQKCHEAIVKDNVGGKSVFRYS